MSTPSTAPTWYRQRSPTPPPRPPLAGQVEAEVCVVGGGLAGLATVLGLAERGCRAVLLGGWPVRRRCLGPQWRHGVGRLHHADRAPRQDRRRERYARALSPERRGHDAAPAQGRDPCHPVRSRRGCRRRLLFRRAAGPRPLGRRPQCPLRQPARVLAPRAPARALSLVALLRRALRPRRIPSEPAGAVPGLCGRRRGGGGEAVRGKPCPGPCPPRRPDRDPHGNRDRAGGSGRPLPERLSTPARAPDRPGRAAGLHLCRRHRPADRRSRRHHQGPLRRLRRPFRHRLLPASAGWQAACGAGGSACARTRLGWVS